MKAKSFFTSLRKVIREEVQRAVRTEIQNVINNSPNANNNSVANNRGLAQEVKQSMGFTNKENLPEVEYSSNPMINNILNETAKQYKQPAQQTGYEEYPTMNNKPFNTGDLASMLGYGDMQPQQPTVNNMVPKGVNPQHVTDDVANALTRDYSSLMKAIDKKKGIK